MIARYTIDRESLYNEEYSNVKILGLLPNLGERIQPEELITGILNGIDIESIFNIKIEKLDFN